MSQRRCHAGPPRDRIRPSCLHARPRKADNNLQFLLSGAFEFTTVEAFDDLFETVDPSLQNPNPVLQTVEICVLSDSIGHGRCASGNGKETYGWQK